MCARRWPSVATMAIEAFGLEHEQRAVERVAGLSSFEMAKMVFGTMSCLRLAAGSLYGAGFGKGGDLRKIRAGHADHACVLERPAADLHPVVVHEA